MKDTCPHCGYCPHCKRGGHRVYPYWQWVPQPYPVTTAPPTQYYPWTVTSPNISISHGNTAASPQATVSSSTLN